MGADLLLLGTGIVLLAFGTVATDVETTVVSRSARAVDSEPATLFRAQRDTKADCYPERLVDQGPKPNAKNQAQTQEVVLQVE